jgi:hypothetical protein
MAVNVVDDVPGRHSLRVTSLPATKSVAAGGVVSWFGGTVEYFGGYANVQPPAADGDWRLVWQFLRPVAARVLSVAWWGNADIFAGGAWPLFVPSGEHFSLANVPDHWHLLKESSRTLHQGQGRAHCLH